MSQEKMQFQAEVKQLLHLMIHSLYSNKEIFLRELISNASDAADKLRFEAISDPTLFESTPDLQIKITFDADKKTISVDDNGIGMNREEIIEHLGTIAKSGTKEFFQRLSGDQQRDAALIGQFGVGFYSAFIVADNVIVETRRAGCENSKAVRWQSTGEGEFTIEDIVRSQRGTCVTLHLKDSEHEFLSNWRLKSIVQKYSDHISLPILMHKEEWDSKTEKSVKQEEIEVVNQAGALWTRPKNSIDETQYKNFYQHLTNDSNDPLIWTHNRVEGNNEYTQLLYIPSQAQFDLWDRSRPSGLKLYVKRIFIMDNAEALLPMYLRFVRGIVDAMDLPLNISREILQESRDIRVIREGVTKRTLLMIEDLSKNFPDKFEKFWKEFGQVFKEGIGEDQSNRERIAKLLRFASTFTNSEEQTVSFTDYISRMNSAQTKIYYSNADNYSAAANSPHLEVFRKKNIEVLLLSDRVDAWMLSYLPEFNGKPIISVARGELDLIPDETEKAIKDKTHDTFQNLLKSVKSILVDKVKDVRLTFRLTESPSCLVADEGELTGHLQRMLKAAGQSTPNSKPILELNPEHPLIKNLKETQPNFSDWCYLLFNQALLAEGGSLDDPATFVKILNKFLISEN